MLDLCVGGRRPCREGRPNVAWDKLDESDVRVESIDSVDSSRSRVGGGGLETDGREPMGIPNDPANIFTLIRFDYIQGYTWSFEMFSLESI